MHKLTNIITIKNRELFWMKMNDLKKGLGVKNMSDLVKKEIHGVYSTKNTTKERIVKYKMREKVLDDESNFSFRYVRNDIMS